MLQRERHNLGTHSLQINPRLPCQTGRSLAAVSFPFRRLMEMRFKPRCQFDEGLVAAHRATTTLGAVKE